MTQASLATVVPSIRKAVLFPPEEYPDGQLLQDFVGQRDQAAFTLIIRRHGPMVLGVCRRVLHHTHDAEDAFQATFLVLARKAAEIRKRDALASWLHGVSYRIAMKAKRDAARRRKHETRAQTAAPRSPASDEAGWREVQAVLDEEVERLPAVYRSAFVLCCLQGLTQAEAARQLGVKEGTVSSRLTGARKRLQEALSRRGITLSAVLAGLALSGGARATVSVPAAEATARAAAQYLTGDMVHGPSTKVLTLAEGALKIMLVTRITLATALLLVLGLTGAGALLLQQQPVSATEPFAAPAQAAIPKDKKPPLPAKDKPDTVEVKGRVLGPEGKPFAGASVRLWTGPGKGLPMRAITGEDGGFRFTARKAELGAGATVVVTAKGHGPDWVHSRLAGMREGLTLRLGQELPLEGRILTLEGKPVARATVEVLRVEKPTGKDLTAWMEAWARDSWPSVTRLDAAVLGRTAVLTGKDGRFSLRGFGQERVVVVRVSGEDIERTSFWVLTRPGTGPAPGIKRRGQWATYLAHFDHFVAPTKPIMGTVRDKRTGKPIAGITVVRGYVGEAGEYVPTTTDAQGRYRLTGGPKRNTYIICVDGKPGVPYFHVTNHNVRDTPDLDPVTADFELERGLEVSGRLLDAKGKPVRGQVQYVHLPDNPHLKDYPSVANPGLGLIVSVWGLAGDDGRFTVLTIPGPGVLLAAASEERRFAMWEPVKELHIQYRIFIVPNRLHAVAAVNPSADDPKSLRHDIVLEPGRSVSGKVMGPDGKPLAGAHVAGLFNGASATGFGPRRGDPLKGAEFTVHGLNPRHPRSLVFFHPEKRLARVLPVRGDEKEPLVVRLSPLGTIRGRLLDASGRPVAEASVSALFQPRFRQLAGLNLPGTELYASELNRLLQKNAQACRATTDDKGEFRLEGLVPGLPYELMLKSGDRVAHWVYNVIPEAGKETKIGDLKTGGTTDLGTPELKLTPEDRGN